MHNSIILNNSSQQANADLVASYDSRSGNGSGPRYFGNTWTSQNTTTSKTTVVFKLLQPCTLSRSRIFESLVLSQRNRLPILSSCSVISWMFQFSF